MRKSAFVRDEAAHDQTLQDAAGAQHDADVLRARLDEIVRAIDEEDAKF